jgi:hypothetical protein
MKTPVMLDLFCNIANAFLSTINTALKLDDETLEAHGAYNVLGDIDDAARHLYRALPETLRNEEMDDIMCNLYVHQHRQEGFSQRQTLESMRVASDKIFHFAYDLHAEMRAAKDKFGLSE